MNPKKQLIKYLVFDLLAAIFSWTLFFIYRKKFIETEIYNIDVPLTFDKNFFVGIICIPVFWISFYSLTGYYTEVYRKSRLKEFLQTLSSCFIGCLILFFTLVLNDFIKNYTDYYQLALTLFGLHFGFTALFRSIITTSAARKIHRKEIGFPTLIIGGNQKAVEIYDEIENLPKSPGNLFVGFLNIESCSDCQLEEKIPRLGHLNDLLEIIKDHKVEEVIIALESSEHDKIKEILNTLSSFDIVIKVLPDMYDILSGSVKMNSIFGAALIEISFDIMPAWQRHVKRIFDVIISSSVLILGTPIYIVTAIMVKQSSKGPIFFKQERIGLHGKPFYIIKFRSMYIDAEKEGPQLSSENDNRITPWGKFMRKTRLDEIPQFYNVLIGEMTLVGPRPERQFFIDQIVQKAPHYYHLTKVKPGITSWGQVKYGYAENVDEMVQRLKYDLIYLENMSLMVDIKIMIYTILIVFQGRGK